MFRFIQSLLFRKENDEKKSKLENFIKYSYDWKMGPLYKKYKKHKLMLPEGKKSISHIKKVDLRNMCPSIYNQGKLGSCTANAIAFLFHFCELKQNTMSLFMPSRLFIYYNERNMEGTVNKDSGAEIHDGIHSIHNLGVCDEKDWPYDIKQFTQKPDEKCYDWAIHHVADKFHAIEHDIEQLKLCLFHGYPVSFGFNVYSSFETKQVAETGIMKMPSSGEKILGGHAVALVGYDDDKECFIVRNSWGESWGDNGYFYMPYKFIENKDYTSDFWIVTHVIDSQKGMFELKEQEFNFKGDEQEDDVDLESTEE